MLQRSIRTPSTIYRGQLFILYFFILLFYIPVGDFRYQKILQMNFKGWLGFGVTTLNFNIIKDSSQLVQSLSSGPRRIKLFFIKHEFLG